MNLKKLRLSKEMTQEQMAKVLSTTHTTYGNYELGKTEPNINTLKKIADYFGVSVDYILDYTPHNEISLPLLNEVQKQTIQNYFKLNQINQIKATAYIDGLLMAQ